MTSVEPSLQEPWQAGEGGDDRHNISIRSLGSCCTGQYLESRVYKAACLSPTD